MPIGGRISHYEILERLGGGERGEVFRVRDLDDGRLVALKLVAAFSLTVEERRSALDEARLAVALDHPNVCPLYEMGETEAGELFFAMAFCPGESLKARLARGPLPFAEALDVAAEVAAGLAAAHERGLVHRAVKPGNVMLSPDGRVQVVDFDLVRLADAAAPLTQSDMTLGTTAYLSPEQIRGGTVDARTDVWSLGVVLYEMLTGSRPFAGSDEEVARAILQDAPVPLALRLPGLPAAVSALVERALAKPPAARYARISEMRTDLLAVDTLLHQDETATAKITGEDEIPPAAVPPLLPGRRISHFRIDERLAGGGMGVLYRAEDVRLGRAVALKFLAPELVRHPVANARFLNEARAASALEHPNVCTLLDVGETEEGLFFLAMPLYEGESLDRRLERGPLPVTEALDIATQAARGLAKAHQHGIVHRDIKPANLFLTVDGVVKVLDFGIAKLAGEAGPTREGVLPGTPFYMAPEQTRGSEVDARADVWALGVVLYQMLAGRRPFDGASDAAVIYNVRHEEPEPLSHLRPEVTPEVEQLVATMLSKDPEQRYANAGEVLVDLRRAQGLASVTPPPESAVRKRRVVGSLAVILGVALAVAVCWLVLLVWRLEGEAQDPQPINFRRLTDYSGKETFPSLSPDGTYFVYVRSVDGESDIFLQRVSGSNPINLTANSHSDNTQPAFSPKGDQIAFRSERDGGGIFLMGATGESVRRLTDFGFNPSWSPDGREILVATESVLEPSSRVSKSQIFRIDVAEGTRRSLALRDGVQPSWSPHGWRIAFCSAARKARRRVISTVGAEGGIPVTLIDDSFLNWSPTWSPDGKFLYFASDRGGSMNLWRVAVDEHSGIAMSAPEPVTTPAEWSALPSLSRDGRYLLYATVEYRSFIELIPFDPEKGETSGSRTLVFQGSRRVASCELSPDGAWLVFWTIFPQEVLFVVRPNGTELRQLTYDGERARKPHWSPDGRRILYYSNRSGKYEAWSIRPDGSGLAQVTHLPAYDVSNPAWSPDGRHIGFTYGPRGATIMDFLGSPSSLRVLPPVEGGQVLARVSWSPDGQFLAGILLRQDESPVPGVVLWSLAHNTCKRLTQTGTDPVFFHDGTQVLFIDSGAVRSVNVVTGEVRTLVLPPLHSSFARASPGPGDRTLCTARTSAEGDIWSLSLVEPAKRP